MVLLRCRPFLTDSRQLPPANSLSPPQFNTPRAMGRDRRTNLIADLRRTGAKVVERARTDIIQTLRVFHALETTPSRPVSNPQELERLRQGLEEVAAHLNFAINKVFVEGIRALGGENPAFARLTTEEGRARRVPPAKRETELCRIYATIDRLDCGRSELQTLVQKLDERVRRSARVAEIAPPSTFLLLLFAPGLGRMHELHHELRLKLKMLRAQDHTGTIDALSSE